MHKDYEELETFFQKSVNTEYTNNLVNKLEPLIKKYPNAFFAKELVKKIKDTPGQEIATHTYSHLFCDNLSISEKEFLTDIEFAIDIANKMNIKLETIVFPRNQVNKNYFNSIKKLGFKSFRDNPEHKIYKSGHENPFGMVGRLIRLLNAYLPLLQNKYFLHKYSSKDKESIKASFFLRPWSKMFSFLEFLKIVRIKRLMTKAAKNKLNFHLWWHPHNFGSNLYQNISNLEKILIHYQHLKLVYGLESCSMIDIYRSTK